MSSDTPDAADQYEFDPVFLNSRREAWAIFMTWFVVMIWAVPVCYLMGYEPDIDSSNVSMIMGIPTWVFWGIVLPWLVADVVTGWFCFKFMKNDDLGTADDEHSDAGQEVSS
jgi:fatty acid desaturase